jgi:hypothetical protein
MSKRRELNYSSKFSSDRGDYMSGIGRFAIRGG